MAKDDIITGLDIGSTTIRVVVGQRNPNDEKVHILGLGEHPSEGISKGVVNSLEDAVSSISGALEKAERMTGIPIEHVFVGISGSHIFSQDSHGVVAVSKADGEIREDDVARAIEAARTVATPQNYEILHVIPRNFAVDNQSGIKDPLGMTGIRLEVDAQIIQGLSSQMKNMTKCIYRTSVDIDDLVLGILASSESALTNRQKDLGVAHVNIGGATTSVMVFEEGDVIHTAILPVGAGHITNDIAIGLRTSIDVAERIKLEHGSCIPDDFTKRDEIDLKELGADDESRIGERHVAEIIEARVEEIFKLVDKELEKIERSGLLPAGVVLSGGGAKLKGIVECAKRCFKLPAAVGYPRDLITAIDKVNDPAFTTAVGLVQWGTASSGEGARHMQSLSSVIEVTDRMKKWVRSLMP
ncbi:MAG: cell division protein FtsA [Candidatus Kerfeldbacteria bacterium]|nr:cell division protein FtsA [Candidatus Kerfeldbacteria bacterium]